MKRIDSTIPNSNWFAVKHDLPDIKDRLNPDTIASLDRWILHMPGPSPFWKHYVVIGCSLADFPGVEPAIKKFPDATHEIVVAAIDPQYSIEFLNKGGISPLEPLNYITQIKCKNDKICSELLEHISIGFINGDILIEPQGIRGARELYHNYIDKFLKEN